MGAWDSVGGDDRLRLLEAALEQTRASACITDAELDAPGPRIVYVNPAYCRMTGRSREDVIGKTPRIMQGALTDRSELDRLRRDLTAGRAFTGETVNYRADGSPFEIAWRIDPIVGPDGSITNYVATQQDVTEIRRAERLAAAERILDRALTQVLGRQGGPQADVLAMAEATAAAIDTVVPFGSSGVSITVRTADGPLTVETGRPLPDDPAPSGDRITHRTTADGDLELSVGLPLDDGRGRIRATVTLDEHAAPTLDGDGLAVLVDRIPLVVDAALEYERRRTAALELQRSLLPRVPGSLQHRVVTRYLPRGYGAEVGGDFYDVVDLGDRLVVVIGDVAGSGLRSAADMGRLAVTVRSELRRSGSGELALQLADELCTDDGLFATAAVLSIGDDGTLEIRSAGHLPPLVRHPDGTVDLLPVTVGPPLGAGVGGWPATCVSLVAGDQVAVCTDGLVERRDLDVLDGLELLAKALADAPGEPVEAVDAVLAEILGRHPATDDLALVVATAAGSVRP